MVIYPIKTKSMTIATKQKHQLSPLPLDLVLNGAKIDQVSEHHLLSITINNELRWDYHTNVSKTISRRVFLLSKLRYIVDIDTRKLFFKAVKLIFPDTTLTTDHKLKEMRIMSLQKQLEFNKGLFMYSVLNNEAPEVHI